MSHYSLHSPEGDSKVKESLDPVQVEKLSRVQHSSLFFTILPLISVLAVILSVVSILIFKFRF